MCTHGETDTNWVNMDKIYMGVPYTVFKYTFSIYLKILVKIYKEITLSFPTPITHP